ncbi:MAG: Gfo/Idh/MocA family oxidoreductase [Planctomycetales bacterium]|nr:Gfo/Idh/MocA family oxidoreductase [Planctomycetales bacterium]
MKAHEPAATIPAPELPYQPELPPDYRPAIGLIGCGGITVEHLQAYRDAGLNVVALCDLDVARATERQGQFYPDATVYADYRELLARDEIEVVDVATHPAQRVAIVEAALYAGKHVLSQKPFVLDLDEGQRLVELADRRQRQLAVNQNGRWAPHFSYARQAIQAGLLGTVAAVHLSVHWDHTWVAGTEFENIKHLVLYDFAIHWFDIAHAFLGGRPARKVYATTARWPGQTLMPPLLAEAMIEYDDAQASLVFDAATPFGQEDSTYVAGTQGTLRSVGPDLFEQTLTLTTSAGAATPKLEGRWFPDGFRGTMGELLRSIAEGREPVISGRRNLDSLAICFAAVASAESGQPVVPGSVRRMTE